MTKPHPTAPLFLPFEPAPPAPAACLDALYAAFQRYRPVYDWCRQCFPRDESKAMRAHDDRPRQAPYDAFSMIYGEHPNCTGGRDTSLFWLPRAMEIAFFEEHGGFKFLPEEIVRYGPWFLPMEEQTALRDVLTRALIGVFERGDPAPLASGESDEDWTVHELVEALRALRIDPAAWCAWLSKRSETLASDALIGLLREPPPQEPVYFVLERKEREDALRAAIGAYGRLTREAALAVLTPQWLEARWFAVREQDDELAGRIDETLALRDAWIPHRAPQEIAEDEALIRAALSGPEAPARPLSYRPSP